MRFLIPELWNIVADYTAILCLHDHINLKDCCIETFMKNPLTDLWLAESANRSIIDKLKNINIYTFDWYNFVNKSQNKEVNSWILKKAADQYDFSYDISSISLWSPHNYTRTPYRGTNVFEYIRKDDLLDIMANLG